MTTARVSAYRWVPPFAQGYVKDLRVRWALEEAGIPYEVMLIDLADRRSASYLHLQPFGQVPIYEDDEVDLFESGAIVIHIATKSLALAPVDTAGRVRVTAWIIAALNSIEPHAQNFIQFDGGQPDLATGNAGAGQPGPVWAEKYRAQLRATLEGRLAALSGWLGERQYLEDRFTAGDLMMTTVLRELVDSGVLSKFSNLGAYRQRCEERPAFGRALAAQLTTFRENEPVKAKIIKPKEPGNAPMP